MTDADRIREELKWLKRNPAFEERPATIKEFLGPNYLNIDGRVREAILEILNDLFGEKVDGERIAKYALAIVTGGVGIGKTTIASIVLPYMAHWVLCLRDPQDFFNLLPGSRIAFMQMSTSESQAKEVVFGDIKARIEYSPWFSEKYPFDRAFKNQIRFPKDIWILPGDSAETTFEGYNILGGILDEADSHKITKNKDYAEQGFTTIHSRIESRFTGRGFLLVIGQMKKANGFAARKYAEFQKDPLAYSRRMAIWESFGWDKYLKPDGTRDSFWYDVSRKEIIPAGVANLIGKNKDRFVEVPKAFLRDFMNNPEKALRDLAGIPPLTGSPFISLTYKIESARDRWIANHGGYETPVDERGRIAKWFMATEPLKRVIHIDMAYAEDGDSLGLAMGHVRELVEREDELKPYIVFDLLMRIHAPAGQEIFIGDVRRIVYELRDAKKFRIVRASMDGFQSTDTIQQFNRRRIEAVTVSVDKQMLPYEDLREALYEERLEFPKYMVRVRPDDTELTEIAFKELSELEQHETKIDHPENGSKDVADAMAGVVYSLMGDRSFHRKIVRLDTTRKERQEVLRVSGSPYSHPALTGDGSGAPLPPTGISLWNPSRR